MRPVRLNPACGTASRPLPSISWRCPWPQSNWKASHSSLSIDLNNLKEKEYKIKITNYRGNSVNEEELTYSITVKNDTSEKIILAKEDEKNLMIDQKETTISDIKLPSKSKESTIYTIKLENGSNPSEKDKITVEITS